MKEKRHYYVNGRVVIYEPQFGKYERMQIGRDNGSLSLTWQSLIAGEDFGIDKFDNRFAHTDHIEIVYNPETELVDKISVGKLSEPKLYETISRGQRLGKIDEESLERILNDARDVFMAVRSEIQNLKCENSVQQLEAETIRKYVNSFKEQLKH